MRFSKSILLPLAGLIVFIFFITLSYFNNYIFLDKIVICGFIVGLIFFTKTIGESTNITANSDGKKYTDPS